MKEVNVYCDESNHLEVSNQSMMILAAISCPKEEAANVNKRIREIKARHNLSATFEIKWTKISPAKVQFYMDVIDYFFDNDDLSFRALVMDKSKLDHKRFDQTHDNWYYKMYFLLLSRILEPQDKYFIYLDIKDTNGSAKIEKLQEVLCNSMYDFEREIIKNVQQVRSHEVEILQITDLLAGAFQAVNRTDIKNAGKLQIIERIQERSGYDLLKTTLLREAKTNILYWRGGGDY
ncbi:MAG: DUF3800 domain-containing protein [Bacteroidetes bacterium]|nr:DUF3800 domain-containing protein [Gammaproteobacteria bacterium]MBU1820919.1 DUF3800 domain-containing protein [Bacteroidota bacterium]